MNEQVDILNKAYAPSKFHFNLQSIGRTVNETWAYATYPSTDRFDFRKGNYTTLNVALTDNIIYELEKDEDSVVFIEPSGVGYA